MTLASGTRLGPYEIVSALGAGGMGEVYRARDARLGRDVAVKVLPAAFAGDADRLRRFEQEARAASQLNHPNILTILDVGTSDGMFYLVSELLDGETLRARLATAPLPVRKAIDCASQVAQAIAAAHDKGIVHRDLKPENIFVTRDGRVKVLDFGLAKLREGAAAAAGDMPTLAADTGAGIVLGTVGYMSPEQVRGLPADSRADIFALGTVLYEMLSGRRAFQRDSAAETMTAIVRDEPPPLEQAGVAVPPGIARVIDHCLEKNPDERFQSARDLAFDLRALSDTSGPRVSEASQTIDVAPRSRRGRLAALVLALVALAAVAASAFVVGRRSAAAAPTWFDKITFRQGDIRGARFAPDGRTILYTASWSGGPEQVFLAQPGNPESRALDLPSSRVLAVSKSGEMLVLLNPRFAGGFIYTGTLGRAPASGGAPRELLENVEDGDWGPDGESIAVVRTVAGRGRVEFPIGTVLYETPGWISSVRVSPRGDAVAFLHHPFRGNDAGDVMMVDRNKRAVTLSPSYLSVQGLAWAGDDILYTGAPTGATRRLYTVSRSGNVRLAAAGTGSLFVYDAAPDGQVLIARTSDRIGLVVRTPADAEDRGMSWLDWTLVRDMSADGKVVTFDETGEGGGLRGSVYMRRTDGSPAVRLGDGGWPMLSDDGKWVACFRGDPARIVILPTGAGESRTLATPGITPLSASWFPDGRRLLVTGNEPGHGLRVYVVPLDGGSPKAITPDGTNIYAHPLSPDVRYVLAQGPDAVYALFPVDGGPPVAVKGLGPNDVPVRMPTADSAYVFDRVTVPMPVSLVDLKTGKRTPVMTIGTRRPAETGRPFALRIAADPRTYAYSYFQTSSELFLMRKGEQ